ncbi:translation initiation factor IF-2-like [Canis lupus familiaris]|uniref:translation initiation factor IF-2-like n=1 Tax=Canis lupus familiaris TaxID=9615 RepID=UPI000DC6A52A|nr:translation initiation factor IF-2-like [Canis lupus familiaris]XP_038503433.1 translation initiation factor IF-2-like [Canis lupus familiaris]XP_038536408.1 translation initiation factor IF-2-like [Canis lupus familiaris]
MNSQQVAGLPTHAVLASTGSRASAPEPSRERSRPPTPPAPPLPGCQEPFRPATGAPGMTGGAGRAPRNGAQGGSYLRKAPFACLVWANLPDRSHHGFPAEEAGTLDAMVPSLLLHLPS